MAVDRHARLNGVPQKMSSSADPIRLISKIRNNRLMEVREQMGMSTKQFAAFLGISYRQYNGIENLSHYPSQRMVERIADKIGSAAYEAFPEYLRHVKTRVIERTIPEEDVLRLGDPSCRHLLYETRPNIATLSEDIEKVLEGIPRRLATVIRMRFALDGGDPKSLGEIAKTLGVSAERVRQMEISALRKLRNPTRSKDLRDDWRTRA